MIQSKHYSVINCIIYAIWLEICLTGCVSRDLQPIGDSFYPDSSSSTETGSNTSLDSQSETDTPTDDAQADTHTDMETDAGSDSDSGTGTESDSESDSAEDVPTDPHTGTDTTSPTDSGLDPDTETRKKWVGNTTQNGVYPTDFFDLWDQVTPENAGKWGEIEKERNNMEWEPLDGIYQMAVDNGIKFKGHTLIWDEQQPMWMNNLAPVEQRTEVEEWIYEFCNRYPNMEMLNVVTHAVHSPPPYQAALGGSGATGYDWVVTAFEMARKHCPKSQLLVEDYNALIYQTDVLANLVKILNDRKLIDGIGCFGGDLEGMNTYDLRVNINTLAAFGLPLYIAGFNVENPDDSVQKYIMEELFPVLYEHQAVAGITLWGYVEGQIWEGTPNAFLRRSDGSWRPALVWLMDYLSKNK